MNKDNRDALGVTDESDLNTLRFDVDRLVAREEDRHRHRMREEELRVELRKADDVWRERTDHRIDRIQETTEKLHDQLDHLPARINGQMKEAVSGQAVAVAQAAKVAAEAVSIAAALAAKERVKTIGADSVKKALTRSTRWIISVLTMVCVGVVVATQLSLSHASDDRIPVLTGTIVAAIAVLSFVWYQSSKSS
jgi:hypothetical protein